MQELASGKASNSAKRRLEDDMDEHIESASNGSPSRRSGRIVDLSSTSVSFKAGALTPPGKASAAAAAAAKRAKTAESEAFEAAIRTSTTTLPTKPIETSSASKKMKVVAVPALPDVPMQEEDEEEQDLPYEPYTDDLLRRWRTKVNDDRGGKAGKSSWWDALKEDTEAWKNEMLDRLQVAELVA